MVASVNTEPEGLWKKILRRLCLLHLWCTVNAGILKYDLWQSSVWPWYWMVVLAGPGAPGGQSTLIRQNQLVIILSFGSTWTLVQSDWNPYWRLVQSTGSYMPNASVYITWV